MHIHEAIVGDVRLYVLVTDLVGGGLQAGVAITRQGETLWRLDEMMLPASVLGADDALQYAVEIGHEIAMHLRSGPAEATRRPAMSGLDRGAVRASR